MLNASVLLRRSPVNILNLICIVRVPDLLRARRRWKSILDAASDNAALEQEVDRLERHTLGLRNTENGVDTHDNTTDSEQQEGAVSDIREHDWRDFRNYKVEQPLSHESGGHDERANVVGRALGRKHEGNGTPAERVEDDEEVDAYDGEDSVAVQLAGGWVHSLVDADVEHGESLPRRANQKRPLKLVSTFPWMKSV